MSRSKAPSGSVRQRESPYKSDATREAEKERKIYECPDPEFDGKKAAEEEFYIDLHTVYQVDLSNPWILTEGDDPIESLIMLVHGYTHITNRAPVTPWKFSRPTEHHIEETMDPETFKNGFALDVTFHEFSTSEEEAIVVEPDPFARPTIPVNTFTNLGHHHEIPREQVDGMDLKHAFITECGTLDVASGGDQ